MTLLRTTIPLLFLAMATPLRAEAPVEAQAEDSLSITITTGESVIAEGDSLDRVLARSGIVPADRTEAALAFEGVYDLRDLRPGNVLRWTTQPDDAARLSTLQLLASNGVEVSLVFTDEVEAVLLEPEVVARDRMETLVLDGSLYDALIAADAPARFAVDLTALMAGQVDFRRDLRGGETFALIWQEDRLPDGSLAGEPRLSYARLSISGHDYELVASDPASPVLLFEDGELVQRSAPPIMGARLSSVFGNRNHPVLGGRRMHTGIDYAAPIGTPVNATGAGRVVFAGTIRGYGMTIDINHGGGVITRYAHLSAFTDGIANGTRIRAGDRIGSVGATGLVSGPNLHYEVRVDGRPIDPMEEDAMPVQEVASAADIDALTQGRLATNYTSEQEG